MRTKIEEEVEGALQYALAVLGLEGTESFKREFERGGEAHQFFDDIVVVKASKLKLNMASPVRVCFYSGLGRDGVVRPHAEMKLAGTEYTYSESNVICKDVALACEAMAVYLAHAEEAYRGRTS